MANEYKLSFTADEINKKLSTIVTPAEFKPSYIDPDFDKNSWDTIAWVAKNDDPSKYWKVGDYKMLDIPVVTTAPFLVHRNGRTPYLKNTSANEIVGTIEIVDIPKLINKLATATTAGTTLYNSIKAGEDLYFYVQKTSATQITIYGKIYDEEGVVISTSQTNMGYTRPEGNLTTEDVLLRDFGILISLTDNTKLYQTRCDGTLSDGHFSYIVKNINKTVVERTNKYPVMIVDMNKDNVSDPYSYGKSKAGLTMCIGITRGVTETAPPGNYSTSLNPNLFDCFLFRDENDRIVQLPYLSEDGKSYSPYFWCDSDVLANTTYIKTQSWEECQMRSVLQHLFDSTAIKDILVPVEKMTATGIVKPEYNYVPRVFTTDTVFLPSEYELNGVRPYTTPNNVNTFTNSYACVNEGDTYELFKRGVSRFFWTSNFLNQTESQMNIWTRSKVRGANNDIVKGNSGACYLKCWGTHGASTVSYKLDAGNVEGYILPMFCI